jgi:hypothetical protein
LPYADDARVFYRRFALALPVDERAHFEAQIARAQLEMLDNEHDTFKYAWPYPDELRISGDIIEATYADDDGAEVNVFLHLVGGLLSWAERFRNLGDPIALWPPPPDAPLRFTRYE